MCAVRLLLVPLAHVGIHALAYAPGAAAEGASAVAAAWPFHLVLLLQPAMPCALSVQAVFQSAGIDARPYGLLMAAQYVLAVPTVSTYFTFATGALGWLVPPP